MALNILHLSIENDSFSDDNFKIQTNENKTFILSILINNESFFDGIINSLKSENINIFIYTTKLLIDLFDSDSYEHKIKIVNKRVLDIYLSIFDCSFIELDEISLNFIFEFFLNYFNFILCPLLFQENANELEITLREDLKKALETFKNVTLLTDQEIRIKIITFIGNLSRSFKNNEVYIQELIKSKIIDELMKFSDIDSNLSDPKLDNFYLYFHLLFKILEYLTSQSKIFLNYILHDLKIVEYLNNIDNKFFNDKSVKKSAYKLLFQISLGSKEDAFLLLDCFLITQIKAELSLAKNNYEIGVIKCILKILKVLLNYEDPIFSRTIYSKELLIVLFGLIDEKSEIINDIFYVELLVNIIEKFNITNSHLDSQNAKSSNNFFEDIYQIEALEKFQLLIKIFEAKILEFS